MRTTNYRERCPDPSTRAEAQRGFEMLDRNIALACPIPEGAADVPPARKIRVEARRAGKQRLHGVYVLAERAKLCGGLRSGSWFSPSHFQRSPGEIDAL